MQSFDNNRQDNDQQYAQSYDSGNVNNVDANQANNNVMQFTQNAPQDQQEQVFEQHFSQMPPQQLASIAQQMPAEYNVNPNDPRSVAQAATRLGQERPDVLQGILSHPMLIGVGVALAGLIAKHMFDERREQQQGNQRQSNQQQNNQQQNNQDGLL
ncbi:MAG: hypothetical protein H0U76_13310 [Ktedonobacteraceae bacterium]|nr:hypothetical protein [Ktedonobacteraceae bacterium]